MKAETNKREKRVLIYMPTGRDAELVAATLGKAGLSSRRCSDPRDLVDRIQEGAGAVLLAEEALDTSSIAELVMEIEAQPVWSDLPVIVFSSSARNADALLLELGGKINVIVVERPIRIAMLLSAVRGALRARQRQYQARDLFIQLKEADKQKDLFLATLSHELRTPLNSILGWIQILRHGKGGGVDIDHAIEIIDRNAKSQAEMIADILFLSRVITGKLELRRERVAIGEVVHNAIEIIRPSAESKNLELRSEVTLPDVFVDADLERLGQVFLNLLSNAVKFTPEGGTIAVSARHGEGTIEVLVSDNGQGIDPEFLPHIFERFRQADNTYTRRTGGLGLGLAIVRHLIELHGGTVRAESMGENKGANFYVTLPTVAAAAPRIHEPGAQVPHAFPVRPLQGTKILIVEDDADSREMLTTVLTYQGANVVAAKTAFEGIEMLQEFHPHVLVSDIGLPKEDGYDLIRKIRKLPTENGGGVPAIALTGYVSLQDRQTALFSGFEEHLPKPIDAERLVDVILRLTQGDGPE